MTDWRQRGAAARVHSCCNSAIVLHCPAVHRLLAQQVGCAHSAGLVSPHTSSTLHPLALQPSLLTSFIADCCCAADSLDHATKETLKGLKEGKTGREAASGDDDLAHSARFFPLLAIYHSDEEQLAAAAKQLTTSFQKGDDEAITSEWLARVAYRVIVGRQKPSAAIDAVTKQLNNPFLNEAVKKGQASANQSDVEALRSFGEAKKSGEKTFYSGYSCGVKYGVPAVVHHVTKYEDSADPTVSLIEDVSVGGQQQRACDGDRSAAVRVQRSGGLQGAGVHCQPQAETAHRVAVGES